MSSTLLIPLSALALVGCARHTIPQVTLIPQTRLGTEDFGPGIVSYGQLRMDFALETSGHVIVLRVSDVKRVETIQPLRSGDRTALARGRHHVLAPELRFTNRRGTHTDATTCVWGAGSPYTEFGSAFDSPQQPSAGRPPHSSHTTIAFGTSRRARQCLGSGMALHAEARRPTQGTGY